MRRDKEPSNRQRQRSSVGAGGLRLAAISAAAVGGLGVAATALAQDACEMQQLFPAQPAEGDEFGIAVDLSGDVIIVGAINDDDNGFNAGAAYMFRFDGSSWEQEQKIWAFNGGATDDHFGQSAAVDGTTALIGASIDPGGLIDAGGAYFFEYDVKTEIWTQIQVVVPLKGAAPFDQFGFDLDISGQAAVVGAPGAISQLGLVYVYRFDGTVWVEEFIMAASDGAFGNRFGESVAIDGDIAVVGAPNAAGNVAGSGSSYVYFFNGAAWIQHQKMVPFDGAAGDLFGTSIAVSGNIAVVGSPRDNEVGKAAGSVYVFRFDGAAYRLQDKLTASDGTDGDNFGAAVAVAGETVIVGAWNHSHQELRPGAVYVYRYDAETESWPEVQEIIPRTATDTDSVGWSVALDNDRGVFGAPDDDENGEQSGSAYVYAGFSGGDCNDNGVADSCDILDGTSDDDNGNGVPDECEGVADLDGDGDVDASDLILLLGAWGPCDDCRDCPFDLDGDCQIGTADLIILLGAWGK